MKTKKAKAKEDIVMKEVKSSNIHSVGYSSKRKTLIVLFHNSHLYEYTPVSGELYLDLIQAESVGKFFNQNIKSNSNIQFKLIPLVK